MQIRLILPLTRQETYMGAIWYYMFFLSSLIILIRYRKLSQKDGKKIISFFFSHPQVHTQLIFVNEVIQTFICPKTMSKFCVAHYVNKIFLHIFTFLDLIS